MERDASNIVREYKQPIHQATNMHPPRLITVLRIAIQKITLIQ